MARSSAVLPSEPVSVFTRSCSFCRAVVSLSVMVRSSATISIRESISRIPVSLNLSMTFCRPSRTSIRACWISGSLTTAIRLFTLSRRACACARTVSTAAPTSVLIWLMTELDTVLPKFFSCFSYSLRPAVICASALSSWERAAASWVSISSSSFALIPSILS